MILMTFSMTTFATDKENEIRGQFNMTSIKSSQVSGIQTEFDYIPVNQGYLNVKHYNITPSAFKMSSSEPNIAPTLSKDFDAETEYLIPFEYADDAYSVIQTVISPSRLFYAGEDGSLFYRQYNLAGHEDMIDESYLNDPATPFANAIYMWGYFIPQEDGDYTLGMYSDDGCYGTIEVDDMVHVFADDWSIHAARTTTTSQVFSLQAGKAYPLKMWYHENCYAHAEFKMQMSTSYGDCWEEVPSDYLCTDLMYEIEGAVYEPSGLSTNATIAGLGIYDQGSDVDISITTEPGYGIEYVSVNGEYIVPVSEFTIENLTEHTFIEVGINELCPITMKAYGNSASDYFSYELDHYIDGSIEASGDVYTGTTVTESAVFNTGNDIYLTIPSSSAGNFIEWVFTYYLDNTVFMTTSKFDNGNILYFDPYLGEEEGYDALLIEAYFHYDKPVNPKPKYTLTVESTEGGSSTFEGTSTHSSGTIVDLDITEDMDYDFSHWEDENGDEVILAAGDKVTIYEDTYLKAVFVPEEEEEEEEVIEEEETPESEPDETEILDEEVPVSEPDNPETGGIPIQVFALTGSFAIGAGVLLKKRKKLN